MTESLDESRKLNKGFIFGVRTFYGFIVLGSDFDWYLIFGISRKLSGPSPHVIHILEYIPWAW